MSRRPPLLWRDLLITLCLLVSCTSAALGTHLIEHRFTVYGAVRDGRSFPGTPLSDKEVIVRFTKTGKVLQRGRTDTQGKFSLVLHVHNEDVGKEITVQSQGLEKSLSLQFDPNDATTERRARVELILLPR